MQNKLKTLFDFNVVASNPALDGVIEDSLNRYDIPKSARTELNEDDMELVAAAGSKDFAGEAELSRLKAELNRSDE